MRGGVDDDERQVEMFEDDEDVSPDADPAPQDLLAQGA